jgi:REP element-mobilizing transposase RayT
MKMPRSARKKSNTGIYHVILRGINKQNIFEDDEDRIKFLDTLKEFQRPKVESNSLNTEEANNQSVIGLNYAVYGYCLMGSHIHLLIKEEQDDLGTIMRRIGASFVYWYNWKYDRVGHLFQDRYKSEPVEDDKYLLTVLRYIHQNPIKAGIVKDLKDFNWSSYIEYVLEPKIIDADYILNYFGNKREEAIEAFIDFHKKMEDGNCLDIDESRRIKDEEAIEIIKKTCNINSCKELQGFDNTTRDEHLKILLGLGLSTRQLARLTGVNRNTILKITSD